MKQHYIELAQRKVSDLTGMIAYYESALASDLEAWERKEYTKCLENTKIELAHAQAHLDYIIANF